MDVFYTAAETLGTAVIINKCSLAEWFLLCVHTTCTGLCKHARAQDDVTNVKAEHRGRARHKTNAPNVKAPLRPCGTWTKQEVTAHMTISGVDADARQ